MLLDRICVLNLLTPIFAPVLVVHYTAAQHR